MSDPLTLCCSFVFLCVASTSLVIRFSPSSILSRGCTARARRVTGSRMTRGEVLCLVHSCSRLPEPESLHCILSFYLHRVGAEAQERSASVYRERRRRLRGAGAGCGLDGTDGGREIAVTKESDEVRRNEGTGSKEQRKEGTTDHRKPMLDWRAASRAGGCTSLDRVDCEAAGLGVQTRAGRLGHVANINSCTVKPRKN